MAFESALRRRLFSDAVLSGRRRNDVEVAPNACELRTGTAFRFGSRESESWRFGRLADNRIMVATAVAARAAYPVPLPAMDREFLFEDAEPESGAITGSSSQMAVSSITSVQIGPDLFGHRLDYDDGNQGRRA